MNKELTQQHIDSYKEHRKKGIEPDKLPKNLWVIRCPKHNLVAVADQKSVNPAVKRHMEKFRCKRVTILDMETYKEKVGDKYEEKI